MESIQSPQSKRKKRKKRREADHLQGGHLQGAGQGVQEDHLRGARHLQGVQGAGQVRGIRHLQGVQGAGHLQGVQGHLQGEVQGARRKADRVPLQ